MNTQNKEAGLIKAIILVVIALLILKFAFDFDVVDYISGEEFKTFATGVWNAVKIGWAALLDMAVRLWEFVTGFL